MAGQLPTEEVLQRLVRIFSYRLQKDARKRGMDFHDKAVYLDLWLKQESINGLEPGEQYKVISDRYFKINLSGSPPEHADVRDSSRRLAYRVSVGKVSDGPAGEKVVETRIFTRPTGIFAPSTGRERSEFEIGRGRWIFRPSSDGNGSARAEQSFFPHRWHADDISYADLHEELARLLASKGIQGRIIIKTSSFGEFIALAPRTIWSPDALIPNRQALENSLFKLEPGAPPSGGVVTKSESNMAEQIRTKNVDQWPTTEDIANVVGSRRVGTKALWNGAPESFSDEHGLLLELGQPPAPKYPFGLLDPADDQAPPPGSGWTRYMTDREPEEW